MGAFCSHGTDSGGRAVLTPAATAQSCSKNILVNWPVQCTLLIQVYLLMSCTEPFRSIQRVSFHPLQQEGHSNVLHTH
jgi:hypothetical protein